MGLDNKDLNFNSLNDAEKQEIKKSILQSITPDDVIAAMLYFMERDEIPFDYKKIHEAVYKIKKVYPDLLKDFSFSENDIYHFSRLLERVLFRLQYAGLISTDNPDYKSCRVPRESKQYIQEHILPLFREDDKKILTNMGKMFGEHLNQ